MTLKINRYAFSLVLALMASPFGNCAQQNERPNIVFVLIDDMGWSDLGVYGSSFYETPNIDRLAADGVRFTDAYASSHVCSPSRASIMTGKYPARLKLTDWLTGRGDVAFQRLQNAKKIQRLPLEETTIAEALREQGYRTGMFGKWHLGEVEALEHGFDVQVPQNWVKGGPKAGYYFPFEMDGIDGKPGDYFENGTVQLFNLAEDIGEQNDLSNIEVEKTRMLKTKLDQWRKSVGANMMSANPRYDPTIKPEELYKLNHKCPVVTKTNSVG